MNRRKFIQKAGAFTVTTYALSANMNCSNEVDKMDRKLRFSNLEESINELKKIETAKKITPNGSWSWFQILNHCAQSIEYSLIGYPENKSPLFRMTAGKIASNLFSARGYMTHDLNAPIPKAPEIPKEGDEREAMLRLYKAIEDFRNFTGDLKIHFAYGELSKSDYEKAHAMHIANHLSFVEVDY
ncbi:MAG TPA: DUF1569 domain-containing protein [Leptospiraceae bacterium]|nr:DUF1569 domain-containing protein [Leptospiraceae bacterium]HMW06125.1 DUF1569 domain-containing protein [Leptospiraceae bacterium]HMX30747.1 DUF1569 domain-containing protein [Leptospiraceae bacterium]HMY31786.1 DUF1569 domain-containing protein [Leptospiraceae bacterium]HMZ63117.1 DUF1569 domain-containing protein [Leptospiraceae bacterium]